MERFILFWFVSLLGLSIVAGYLPRKCNYVSFPSKSAISTRCALANGASSKTCCKKESGAVTYICCPVAPKKNCPGPFQNLPCEKSGDGDRDRDGDTDRDGDGDTDRDADSDGDARRDGDVDRDGDGDQMEGEF